MKHHSLLGRIGNWIFSDFISSIALSCPLDGETMEDRRVSMAEGNPLPLNLRETVMAAITKLSELLKQKGAGDGGKARITCGGLV